MLLKTNTGLNRNTEQRDRDTKLEIQGQSLQLIGIVYSA